MSQKILAGHAGQDWLEPDSIVQASLDLVVGNDVSAPLAIKAFREAGGERVFDPAKVILVPDHFSPNKDLASAQISKELKEFSAAQNLEHRFEGSRTGIAHALLPEMGLVLPGQLVVGADSRTITYGALGAFAAGVGSSDLSAALMTGEAWFKVPQAVQVLLTGKAGPEVCGMDLGLALLGLLGPEGGNYLSLEFGGDALAGLDMEARLTICNMMVETGAKNAIFPVDQVTTSFLEDRVQHSWRSAAADPQAPYLNQVSLDLDQLEPLVARPHSPHDVSPATRAGYEPLDQVFIGSCTASRLGDLRRAAAILKGRKVHSKVRLVVIPPTPAVMLQALKEGLIETFVEAGGAVGPPSCGPCMGGHLGVLASGEVGLATVSRNYRGRMGHPRSRTYLAGPAVAAASAIMGRIADPREVA